MGRTIAAPQKTVPRHAGTASPEADARRTGHARLCLTLIRGSESAPVIPLPHGIRFCLHEARRAGPAARIRGSAALGNRCAALPDALNRRPKKSMDLNRPGPQASGNAVREKAMAEAPGRACRQRSEGMSGRFLGVPRVHAGLTLRHACRADGICPPFPRQTRPRGKCHFRAVT